MINSPLSTVDPASLDLAWSKDPNLMVVADVELVVDKLQRDRLTFLANPEAVKKQRSKKTSAADANVNSIEDLGL